MTILYGLLHLLIGLCLGLYFKVLVLVPAALLSAVIVFTICDVTERSVWLPLLTSEVGLQIGYVVSSLAAVLYGAASKAERENISQTDSSPQIHLSPMPAAERILEKLLERL